MSLPHCLLFGNRFVFYICESVSVLHTESFVLFFRLHVVISYSICLFLSNLNFTEHNSLQVHPHCCKWQYFILFYGWVILCVCVSHLLNPVFCWWTLGLLLCLGYYKVLLWKLGCIYLFKRAFSFFPDIYPWVKLVDHMVVLFLIFWGTSILFSIVDVPIYIFTNRVQGFPFLLILQLFFLDLCTFGLCWVFVAVHRLSLVGSGQGLLSSCSA